jgi:hypothetical protein
VHPQLACTFSKIRGTLPVLAYSNSKLATPLASRIFLKSYSVTSKEIVGFISCENSGEARHKIPRIGKTFLVIRDNDYWVLYPAKI